MYYKLEPELDVKRHPVTNALIKARRPIQETLRHINSCDAFEAVEVRRASSSSRGSPRGSPRVWPEKHVKAVKK